MQILAWYTTADGATHGLRALHPHRRAPGAAETRGSPGDPRRDAVPDRAPGGGAVDEARAARDRARRGADGEGRRARRPARLREGAPDPAAAPRPARPARHDGPEGLHDHPDRSRARFGPGISRIPRASTDPA